MSDVEATIRHFIVRNIMLKQDDSAIENDAPLLESGIINSFGIVELVSFIEKEFGVTIPDHDIIPENFQSVRSIASLASQKK